jgi:hypothetical protein
MQSGRTLAWIMLALRTVRIKHGVRKNDRTSSHTYCFVSRFILHATALHVQCLASQPTVLRRDARLEYLHDWGNMHMVTEVDYTKLARRNQGETEGFKVSLHSPCEPTASHDRSHTKICLTTFCLGSPGQHEAGSTRKFCTIMSFGEGRTHNRKSCATLHLTHRPRTWNVPQLKQLTTMYVGIAQWAQRARRI